ncbi:MAG: sigma-54-dependent Fis family transcriptional regulator [Candidatus Puniceispirillaceae bacterium]
MSIDDYSYDIPDTLSHDPRGGVFSAIADSWSRCREFGLRASGRPVEAVLSKEKFQLVMEKNESVRHLVLPELELLYNQIAGTNFMVAYADGGGVVLDSIQDDDFQAGEGGKAVIPGSVWIESHRGTNALGLAIHNRRPAIVAGRDHFFHKLGDLSCFAAPIFDHESNIVGVIDATSNAKSRNDHTLALVKLASRNIENRLFSEQFCDSLILMFHARHEYLPTTSVAMIAVDDYGFIEGANANAKSMLSGLDLSSKQHFGEVFQVKFSDIIDQLRSNEIVRIRDRMGSVVFMNAQTPITRRVIKIDGDFISHDGHADSLADGGQVVPAPSAAPADVPAKPVRAFDDEVLIKEIEAASRALTIGLPVVIDGEAGTGKAELARRIHEAAFDEALLAIIDCRLLTTDNFEQYLFGDAGMIGFFDTEASGQANGKLCLARGGSVLLRNAQALDPQIQSRIADVMTFEDERRREGGSPVITGWLFAGPPSWMNSGEFEIAPAFSNAIDGKIVTAPPLSQRSDFQKVALAIIADLSPDHSLSPVALSILQAENWPGNLKQLRKTIQHAVAQASGKVIRQEIQNVLQSFAREGMAPCPQCNGSPVRAETCVMIKRSWKETGGNVSLVARRLGVSRNTVYKHVREA